MESGDTQQTQTAFKPYDTIFEQETVQAVEELQRPARGLFISGLIAGIGVGISVLILAAMLTYMDDTFPEFLRTVLLANAYAVGFIVVIMGETDLFTEYSTIAILPVLTGQAPVRALARLWAIVYGSNLLGGALFALLLVGIGPSLEIIDTEAFSQYVQQLADYPALVILGSAFLTGWMMGLLSWLVVAARESISQTFFIWLIATAIGFAHLHHIIVDAILAFVGILVSDLVSLRQLGHVLLWTTLGNIAGGIVFAVLIRFSVLRTKSKPDGHD